MNTIAVLSAKGGVGKTSITANLGVALVRAGVPVLLVDLDPQNALCHHLGIDPDASPGCALAILQLADLTKAVVNCEPLLRLLPYGTPSEQQRIAFEDRLRHNPHELINGLMALAPEAGTVIIIDTPPGPSIYVQRALEATRLALIITLPDIASYAAMPGMERLLDNYSRQRTDFIGARYVVNQANSGQTLARDITDIIKHEFSTDVVGRIHTDQFMREALASRQNVLDFAPFSQAAHDIITCADRIKSTLSETPAR
ncbi:MAG: cellulose biosynthesis protein BcsQ [Pusillimonas sp.]